uniref:Uncharacterized protein n=1 Tax=Avena sativa TaxID=4498 RepID=A0ACD5YMJ1_AVESA
MAPRQSRGVMRSPKQPAKLAMLLLLALLLLCNRIGDVHGKAIHENSVDLHALLDFKKGISKDSQGALSNWNTTIHFCRWNGVTCTTTPQFRVSWLNLTGHNLQGQISPSLGNLPFLNLLDLSDNSFIGTFPVLNNPHLTFLLMSYNCLTGINPNALSNCFNLSYLDFSLNQLEGSIPDGVGQLPKLQTLILGENMISGEFPQAILNHSSSLQYLSLEYNMLGKALPSNIGDLLPNLIELTLGANRFDGHIPVSLGNASGLQVIDFWNNSFTGKIPTSLGKLVNLTILNLELNHLEARDRRDWEFLNALRNCASLNALALADNQLEGSIPQSVGNLSPGLQFLSLAGNHLSGQVPQSIGKLSALTSLALSENNLTGTIDGWIIET